MATLLDEVTTDGAGSSIELDSPCTVQSFGTFDGAVVDLEASIDGTNWERMTTFNGLGMVTVDIQGTYYLRGVVRNARNSPVVSLITT